MSVNIGSLARDLGISTDVMRPVAAKNYVSNTGGQAAKPQPQNFLSNAAHSAINIAGGVIGGLAHDVSSTVGNVYNDVARNSSFSARAATANNQLKLNDQARDRYHKDYASGKISKDRFNKLMKDLSASEQAASKDLQDVTSVGQFAGDYAKLGGLGLTVASAGASAAPEVLGANISKVPKIGSVLSRANAGLAESVGAGKALGPKGSLAIPGKVVRNALVTAPTIQAAGELPGQIQKGDVKGAAVNTALLAAPLGIGAAAKVLPKVRDAVETGVYGRKGVLDEVFGTDRLKAHLANNPDDLAKLKQQEIFTKNQPAVKSGNISAPEFLKAHYKSIGVDPQKVPVSQALNDFGTYGKQVAKLEAKHPNLVVSHDFRTVLPQVIKSINKAGGASIPIAEKVQVVEDALTKAGIENPTIKSLLKETLINNRGDASLEHVRPLVQKLVVDTPGVKLDKGYIATLAPKGKAKLPSLEEAAKAGGLSFGKKPAPILGAIGRTLQKAGLSTESRGTETYAKYKSNLDEELQKSGLDARSVLDKLTNYTQKTVGGFGVLDERQLSTSAIKEAIGSSSTEEATKVKKAIFAAYDKMTLGELGASGKIENALYKLPGYGTYRRIQGIGRYELNPFFRLQSGIEAEVLSQNVAKGKELHLPGAAYLRQKFDAKHTDELLGNADKLLQRHLNEDFSILNEGLTSENAADNSLGPITAKLTTNQKLSLGGLVKTMAEKSGQGVDEFLASAPPEVLDNIRSVVQYPRTGFTSSHFAKTMNILVFPSRYNAKLAGIAGKALADMPPLMQIATLKGLSDFNNFLNSDEGIKWQSDNSEVLGVFNYLNPLNNINKILQDSQTGNLSVSDFGLIGGLPLGVITQLIKTQTGADTNPAYLNPKTGDVIPDKIPTTTGARIKMALTDVINSIYSFPGRTFGMSSKSDVTNVATGGALAVGKSATTPAQKELTPYQKRVQSVLSVNKKASVVPAAPTAHRQETQYNNTPIATKHNFAIPAKAKPKGKKAKNKAFHPRPL